MLISVCDKQIAYKKSKLKCQMKIQNMRILQYKVHVYEVRLNCNKLFLFNSSALSYALCRK